MGKYKVVIKPTAAKELEAIPHKKIRQQLVKRIQGLAANPYPNGVTKLAGHSLFRIRQGYYRVVYSVEDDDLVVVVIKIAHRKDVYRAL